jgi:ABC-type bacteriocin/lantibiotic exporter with double-glycine peptidase domain
MANPFNNPFFPRMKRVAQKTNVHCGPAVLEMLYSYLGFYVDQDEIAEAAGISDRIVDYGMTIEDMRRATIHLFPQLTFWYKENSSIADLSRIVNEFGFPVGVEWQGVFYEDSDEDNGHYAVITHVDTANNLIMLADPYERFAGTDRRFHILEFQDRWWDENEVKNPETGAFSVVRDDKMMFIVAPRDSVFPEDLGMKKSGWKTF